MTKRLDSKISRFRWGLIGIVLAIFLAYIILGGRGGLAPTPYKLKAVFRSDAQITISSFVRVAGVNVGQITDIQPVGKGSNASVVTMKIDKDALPIHTDATAKIRTRLLLEGNYYIDVHPGSPAAPVLKTGGTLPVTQTSGPVQLDRLLTDLQSNTRTDLQTVLRGFGAAYGGKPDPNAPASVPPEDPSTRGLTAGQSINNALEDIPQSLLGTAQSTDALQGLTKDDLAGVIRGQADTAEGFANAQSNLAGFIAHFNTTLGAFADEQSSLQRALAVLPDTLQHSNQAFDALDSAFPATRTFARELTPSVRELPATITAADPWIVQSRLIARQSELGGLAKDLRPAVASSAHTLAATQDLIHQTDLTNRCLLKSLLPNAEVALSDPPLSTGVPVYQEFFQGFVGIDSSFQNFDGNGYYGRAQPGGGTVPIVTNDFFGQGPLRGNTTKTPAGTRPAYPGPGNSPAYKPDVQCYTQTRANLAAKAGNGP